MEHVTSWDQIPLGIQKELNKKANLFYGKNYWHYMQQIGHNVLYYYNDSFILPTYIRKTKSVFKQAILFSEPYCFSSTSESLQTFLDCFVAQVYRDYHVDWINATEPCAVFKAYPSKSIRIPFGNYIIDLKKDIDTIFNNFSPSHRRDVRKAMNNNLVVKFGREDLLDDYLRIDNELWERNGKHRDHHKMYANVLSGLGEQAIIGIVYKDGIPQCGRLGFFNNYMFYCMYSATANVHERGAANLLHFEFMKKMKEYGVSMYNFVGCRINVDKDSKQAGIQSFKERFGGQLVNCFLFKTVFHPFKKTIYDFLINTFRKGGGDILEQELHKWAELQTR